MLVTEAQSRRATAATAMHGNNHTCLYAGTRPVTGTLDGVWQT